MVRLPKYSETTRLQGGESVSCRRTTLYLWVPMPRLRFLVSYLVFLYLFAVLAHAQAHGNSIQDHPTGSAVSNAGVPVLPNPSAVALNGPWKFRTGDSPKVTGSQIPLWAQTNFDDSGWQDYTIDPKHSAVTAAEAIQAGELPGWQSHGHPGYTGYAWYRIRFQPPPDADSQALLMPQYVDEAYEVYLNGRRIGGLGSLDGWHLHYPPQPKLFSIPVTALKGGQAITLAVRVWSANSDALPSEHNLDGGLRGLPLFGPSGLLYIFRQSVQDPTSQGNLFDITAYAAVGILCLFLFFFSRRQREYLWAGVSLTGLAVVAAGTAIRGAQQASIPSEAAYAVLVVAYCLGFFALPLAAMYLLGVPRALWRRANYVIFAVLATPLLVWFGLSLGLLPATAFLDRVNSMSLLPYLPFIALLLAIAADGLRTLGRKAWLLLTPGLLWACYLILFELVVASSGRFVLAADLLAACVPLAVLIIFLMRFTEQQRENVRLVDDTRQAQEVQQVLLPEELPQIAGLTIESEYRPAREVGGDFFQIVPQPTDGSVLIVVGDVTGKGLQAGMLVALIVGAIRTQAETSSDPLRVLQALNRRLCGRGHAHATCLALRIEPDGSATLANAGHLPPYLNGKELQIEGALPLGMLEGAEFSVTQFQLAPGDRLMLLSDGIAEAHDKHGQLFGFERIQAMLQKPITAAAIATAAQNFGQEDDISVLSVTRIADMKGVTT
jgi:hypothetical protein